MGCSLLKSCKQGHSATRWSSISTTSRPSFELQQHVQIHPIQVKVCMLSDRAIQAVQADASKHIGHCKESPNSWQR